MITRYHLRVQDIMQTDVATILGDATIQEAVSLMRYEGVRSLLVVPRDGHAQYGIITYADIVGKVIAEGLDPRKITVDDVMIPQAYFVSPDFDVQAAARFFRHHHIGHAPVLDDSGNLLGVLSSTDLVTESITEP